MHNKVKVIIADDEQLSRDLVKVYLQAYQFIEVQAEVANGIEVLNAIEIHRPDLIFLDIQMPLLNGLQVIKELKNEKEKAPLIIFITAYNQYACEAFDESALDYLLKPITKERFDRAINKALFMILNQGNNSQENQIEKFIALYEKKAITSNEEEQENFIIKENKSYFIVPYQDIIYFESAGDYIRVITNTKTYLIHQSLNSLEEKMKRKGFFRIHRTVIINSSYVKYIKSENLSDQFIELKNDKKIKVSRSYRSNVKDILLQISYRKL